MRYQLLDAPVVVVRMTGEVMVVGQDGVTRPVQLGDRLPAGAMLVLDSVANVQLEPVTADTKPIPSGDVETPVPGTEAVAPDQTHASNISPLGAQGTNDIAAIQAAILQGQDPTLNFEATAAGGAPAAGGGGGGAGSGNGGFVTIDRVGGSTLASAGFDTGYISVDALAAPQPTTVLVDVNEPPLAVDDNVTLEEDSQINVNVLANDSDPNGDAITLVGTPTALHGSVVVNNDGSL